MHRGLAFFSIAIVLFALSAATAQTTLPANDDGTVVLDVPAGWVKSSDLATSSGFRARPDATLVASFHPDGARPTDLPYALLEHFSDAVPATTLTNMGASADFVAAYYATALDPPSKADRAGTWKDATVSKPILDLTHRYFTFRATIRYEGGIGGKATYYVSVVGHWEGSAMTVLSTWSDDDARTKHGAAINLLSTNAMHDNTAAAVPVVSFEQRAVQLAKISGVLLILFIVGVQVFVIVKERRQRRAEELAWQETSS